MKKLSLKEIQYEELELLKEFINICKKDNLKYYLMGGTLLGAVRHNGFIPWDDDIDLFMPRPDYDKLINMINNNVLVTKKQTDFVSKELNNYYVPFLKMINKNIIINMNNKELLDKYLWIDIFPMDGMPNEENKCRRFMNKSFIRSHLYVVKLTRFTDIMRESRSIKAGIIKIISKIPMILVNGNFLIKKHIKESKKYDFDNSKYVSNFIWQSEKKQYYKKELFNGEIEIQFEDIKAKAFNGYEQYLRQNYSDYMKLPPEGKRYTHSFDAYKINNRKKGSGK